MSGTISGLPIQIAPMPRDAFVTLGELAALARRSGIVENETEFRDLINDPAAPRLPAGTRMGGQVTFDAGLAQVYLRELAAFRQKQPELEAARRNEEAKQRLAARQAMLAEEDVRMQYLFEQQTMWRQNEIDRAEQERAEQERQRNRVAYGPHGPL